MSCDDCAPTLTEDTDPAIRRVLWFALVANASMFVVEIVASSLSDSVSLQADALDFFGDAANYGISLFVLGMAVTLRARATLIKGATMAAFGCWVIGSALFRALDGSDPDPTTMGVIGTLALAVNVLVAVLLFRFRGGDSNLRSVWLCSRNDAIGNVAVMAAAAGVFATGTRWPDLAVAMLIASLALSAAVSVIRQALEEIRTGQVAPATVVGADPSAAVHQHG